MRVFVTGASGLLGSHTVARLRESGHGVVALQRRSSETAYLRDVGCELAEGDVRDDPEVLARHMMGCTHVLHGAGLVYASGSWPQVRAVNVDGTRNVLEAAARAGVERVVHLSSVAVYGGVTGPVDEDAPIDSDLSPGDLYARSKREAEMEARAVAREREIALTIVRPSAVYGERDRLMAPAVARMLRFPVAVLLGPGDNTLPTVYAGNVAAALLLTLEAGKGEATYDIGMDHPLTQRELLEGMARGMGRSPMLIPTPRSLIQGGANVLQRLGVPTPGARHLPIARVARLALGENPFPSLRIRRELGWNPPYEHAEALERTGRWIRQHT